MLLQRWSLKRVHQEGERIFGNLYDYSLTTEEQACNGRNRITVVCKTCNVQWHPKLFEHFRFNQGCSICRKKRAAANTKGKKSTRCRWSVDRFQNRAMEIHGTNKFDYPGLPQTLTGETRIDVLCLRCNEIFRPTVTGHINGRSGCGKCAKKSVSTSYAIFSERVAAFSDNSINYSLVTERDIENQRSRIKLLCTNIHCKHFITPWETSVHGHVKSQTGCPSCSAKRVLLKEDIWDKLDHVNFNYENVDWSRMGNYHASKMHDVECKLCKHRWAPRVATFVKKPQCIKCIKLTVASVIERCTAFFGSLYDYSLIQEGMDMRQSSKIPVICTTCKKIFHPLVCDHLNNHAGCPDCRRRVSTGERVCAKILDALGIAYQREARLIPGTRLRFDFIFTYQGQQYILEYDGLQHFKMKPIVHASIADFQKQRARDIEKAVWALTHGYKMVRCYGRSLNNMKKFISQALNKTDNLVVENETKYLWLLDAVRDATKNDCVPQKQNQHHTVCSRYYAHDDVDAGISTIDDSNYEEQVSSEAQDADTKTASMDDSNGEEELQVSWEVPDANAKTAPTGGITRAFGTHSSVVFDS